MNGYQKAKAALLKSARERQAELMRELGELESTIQHLNGKDRKADGATIARKPKRSKRTMPRLKHGKRKTLTGHIVHMLESNGAMSSKEMFVQLKERGITTSEHSVQGAVSRAGLAGVLYRVPSSRLWALGKVKPTS
jgi:hypothetical protein